ncbi:MAG: membrane integrity-associated transporter subunit PqiC [Deltaproteobacteria bacterium]|nr:membrane integrity-associated transporter subunit PqiC [Deltaproteobacteria bacterium]
MIADPKPRQVVMTLVAIALTGCGASAIPRFYSLNSSATPNGAPAVQTAVIIEPVSVPPAVDQPQIVVQVAPNQVEVEEFNRWDAPLGDSIARTVAGDLSILLANPNVATAPLANFNPAYTVTINVQRFESVKGETALVDAVWVVRSAAGTTRSGRTIAKEAPQGEDFEALAVAHSRAIAKLSGDIAAVIRADTSPST